MADIKYQIVGRYMKGNEVTGYHLQCSNGALVRMSRRQVCFLVGKGAVINCKGSLGADGKVALVGVGVHLDELPIKREE